MMLRIEIFTNENNSVYKQEMSFMHSRNKNYGKPKIK